mgnify:CR=1 FL=1
MPPADVGGEWRRLAGSPPPCTVPRVVSLGRPEPQREGDIARKDHIRPYGTEPQGRDLSDEYTLGSAREVTRSAAPSSPWTAEMQWRHHGSRTAEPRPPAAGRLHEKASGGFDGRMPSPLAGRRCRADPTDDPPELQVSALPGFPCHSRAGVLGYVSLSVPGDAPFPTDGRSSSQRSSRRRKTAL